MKRNIDIEYFLPEEQSKTVLLKGASLLILAGGDSCRMGFPKHLLPTPGGTMIDHLVNRLGCLFSEVIVAGRGLKLSRTDVMIVKDVRLKKTPLVGILTGLLKSANSDVFVIGCDMPFVKKELIHYLLSLNTESDAVIPIVRGYYEPLCGVYRQSASNRITEYLDSGGSRTSGFYESANITEVAEKEIRLLDPNLESFINLNTPRDYMSSHLSILQQES